MIFNKQINGFAQISIVGHGEELLLLDLYRIIFTCNVEGTADDVGHVYISGTRHVTPVFCFFCGGDLYC